MTTEEKVTQYFKENYGQDPKRIKSPGRVNLIGEHTDYNLGFVLPASIEKSLYFAIGKNSSQSITVEAFLNEPERISFGLNGKKTVFQSFWGKYFQAIIEILEEKKYGLEGVDCVFGGDIPIGFGLSSSAALCCGFTYALSAELNLGIPRTEIALIAQAAEHRIGLNCGLMDQYAVLYGKKGNALFLDCKDLSHDYIPINLKGYSWILINSNIKHELAVDSEYNLRRRSCERVVHTIAETKSSVKSLRDVTPLDLDMVRDRVSVTDHKRALYVLRENARVQRMVKALSSGDAIEVGNILLEGHRSMSADYEITTPEIDFLVDIGQQQEGVVGSRMMGGGFGGCTINLIKDEHELQAVENMIAAYKRETGITATQYHLEIGDSVQMMPISKKVLDQ
ncbi:MAG: galactokinase [Sediminicola sp.]